MVKKSGVLSHCKLAQQSSTHMLPKHHRRPVRVSNHGYRDSLRPFSQRLPTLHAELLSSLGLCTQTKPLQSTGESPE